MSSHLFVSLLMFILLAGVSGYLSVLLLIISFLYIYIGIFSKASRNESIFNYTRIYFRLFNILQFVCLFITTVLDVPVINSNPEITRVVSELGALTSIEELVLMLFIQLWLDLNASQHFAKES